MIPIFQMWPVWVIAGALLVYLCRALGGAK